MMSVKSGPISSFCGKLQDTLSSCSRDVLYRFSGLVEERFGSQFREVTKLVGINFGSWRKLPALLSCSKWCYRILGSSVQELDVHESMISCPWWKVAWWHSCWRVQTVHFSLLSSWKCSHTSVVIWLRDREVHETFQYAFVLELFSYISRHLTSRSWGARNFSVWFSCRRHLPSLLFCQRNLLLQLSCWKQCYSHHLHETF